MAVYPDKVVQVLADCDRTQRPVEPAARGMAASFECGCVVRFLVAVDEIEKKVGWTSYGSNGCGYMLASAEALKLHIEGRRLAELHGLADRELFDQVRTDLGEFPPERLQCAAVVIQALRGAFAAHRARVVEEFRGESALICTCFGVSEDTIACLIETGQAANTEEITRVTRAGVGCGSCRMLIEDLFEAATVRN